MTDLTDACQTCGDAVNQVFDPNTGTRQLELLAGDLVVTDQCFVRDEIRFINQGRLIFAPTLVRQRPVYHPEYFVICRKLTIIGGRDPGIGGNPCSATDPGTGYQGNNVIIWQDRLKAAPNGGNSATPAADGTSFTTWEDQGQGNDGAPGGRGQDGTVGNTGNNGLAAPRRLVVIALEVEVVSQGPLSSSHLTIDWAGQNGGDGGRGQTGGDGGQGMNGRDGATESNTWPASDSCDREPGNGGNGGDGGNGGVGGSGGSGGSGGGIGIVSTTGNLGTGAFANGSITYVFGGGLGGNGGGGGLGGRGSLRGGKPGRPAHECNNGASPGLPGNAGNPSPPPPALDQDPNRGATGATGAAGSLQLQPIQPGTCADRLPLPIQPDANGLQPNTFCRGTAPVTDTATITGQHLGQVQSITTSLSGVTLSIKPSSTDTELDLSLNIAGNTPPGAGNLVLTPVFGAPLTMPNAIGVGSFVVATVTPNSGARGASVNVTIAGACFDNTAQIQQVDISGTGVTVANIVVIDQFSVQCTFTVAATAATGARNVTVKTGSFANTLINGFTVT